MSPAACTARAGHTMAQNRLCEMCAGTVPLVFVLVWPLNCLLRRSIMMTPASEQI